MAIAKHSITVIIPTLWQKDTGDRVMQTLRSLFDSYKVIKQVKLRIVVFANAAQENDQQNLQKKLSKTFANTYVIGSQLNKGFTGGVNESLIWSMGHLKTDWYVVLNDDANVKKLFFERFITEITHTQQSNLGVISCAVEDTNGKIESFGLEYFASALAFPVQNMAQTKNRKKNIFCGTCVWFTKQIVEEQVQKLGYLLNPLYFAYAEDLECSLRLQMNNTIIILIPEALVTHQGSVTAGRASFFQLYYGYRNLILTILVLWSTLHITKNIFWILLGQLYIFLHSLYKGYWILYPKVLWYIFKNRSELLVQRTIYEEHIGHLYSA